MADVVDIKAARKRTKARKAGEGGAPPAADDGPGECPVTPLGYGEGVYWFADPEGQVRSKRQLRPGDLIDLFLGQIDWLCRAFPGSRKGEAWDNVPAAAQLVRDCVAAGPFDARRVRGPGLWWEGAEEWDGDGRPGPVVFHAGDAVYRLSWAAGRMRISGPHPAGRRIGDWVYKLGAPMGRGGKVTAATPDEVGWLLDFLGTWNFARGGVDEHLCLGLIGVGFVPGLLRHRPIGLIEGDSGCGKSTLFDVVEGMHGGAAYRKENATAAHLRGHFEATRAAGLVILNEFEALIGANRNDGLMEWLRYAYTRGEGGWGRGGTNAGEGDGADVAALLGAIMAPPADEADANRRVVLRLRPLSVDAARLDALDGCKARAAALGPKLRRRLLERWPLVRQAYRAYQAALLDGGYAPRGVSTWATVLALADVLAHDAADAERVRRWAERVRGDQLAVTQPAKAPQACLDRILSYRIEEYRGSSKHTVLEYVLQGVAAPKTDDAMAVCKRIGITLTDVACAAGGQKVSVRYLAISTAMTGVEEIFRNTVFAGGLWKGQLMKLDGARAPDNPIRFGMYEDAGGTNRREFRTRQAILLPVRLLGIVDREGGLITGEALDDESRRERVDGTIPELGGD